MASDPCGNLTIVINSTLSIPWSSLPTPYFQFPGTVPAYLRPDSEALLPWIITLLVIITHLPIVVLRVVKWEIIQVWCFVFTGFTIIIYIQTYVSTSFQPADVLVWTPLLLIIDAGSMSQIFFLIHDDIHLTPWAKRTYKHIIRQEKRNQTPRPSSPTALPLTPQSGFTIDFQEPTEQAEPRRRIFGEDRNPRPEPSAQTALLSPPQFRSNLELREPTEPVPPRQQTVEEAQHYFIARVSSYLAVIFLILILVLQILGLVYAVRASHNSELPEVRWCSPVFQPFGLSVRDGNCAIHPIDQSFNKGIGCIALPGVQQAGWITGTIWGTSISLFLQLTDIIILSFTHKKTRFREVKMRRPWCTIIMGLVVLAVMLFFGILYSKGLPEGITSRIWVVVQAGGQLAVYEGELVGAGMRGEVIGWNDALFKSWGPVYFGNSVS